MRAPRDLTPTRRDDGRVDNCSLPVRERRATFRWPHGRFSTVLPGTCRRLLDGPFDPLYRSTRCSPTARSTRATPRCRPRDRRGSPNSGGPADISGVGSCTRRTRLSRQSRDKLGTPAAHNYDQPFYTSTSRPRPPDDADGSPYGGGGGDGQRLDGSGDRSGFNGFWLNLGNDPTKTGTSPTRQLPPARRRTACGIARSRAIPHVSPASHRRHAVTVYTDEHGEADVNYVPGLATTSTISAPSRTSTAAAISRTSTHRSADVTVTARYPYQPVTARDPAAAVAPFVVHSCSTRPSPLTRRAPEPRTPTCASSSHTRRTSTDPRSLTRSSAGASRAPATSTSTRPVCGRNDPRPERCHGRAINSSGQAGVLHRPVQRPAVHHD